MKIGTKRMEDGIMRKSMFFSAAIMSLAACTRTQEGDIVNTSDALTLVARTETPRDTRTIVDSDTFVFWEPGDEIAVFSGNHSARFVTNLDIESPTASFSGNLPGWVEGQDLWAVYPYSEEATFDGQAITTVLPSVQMARAGSFGQGMNLAVAKAVENTLYFCNVGGGVRFSVLEEGIKKVVFEGRNGEELTGTVKIGFDDNEFPKVQEIISGSTSVTLLPPEGQECFDTDVWYYMVAIPGTLEKGYKMTLVKDDEYGERFNINSLSIKRSIYGSIMYADGGVVFENPVRHFPETESEWVQSIALTESLSEEIEPLIQGYKEELIDLDHVLREIRGISGILEAAVNDDHSGIMVMQADSVCINYLIRNESEAIVQSSYPRQQPRKAFGSSTPISRDGSFVSPTKKALVLAPFHRVFCESLDYWKEILKGQFGSNNVDVLSDNAAQLSFFMENNLKQYDFILISTHGVKGWCIKKEVGSGHSPVSYGLLSATPHTAYTMMLLKELGIDPKDCISYESEQGRYLCMTPKFLSKKQLNDCAVVLSACNSGNEKMVDAFLSNGARVLSCTLTEVDVDANNIHDDMLLTYLGHGFSFQTAHRYILSSSKTRTAIEALKSIKERGFWETLQDTWKSLDIPNNYWINSTDPFFIKDPFPYNLELTVYNGSVALSWDCDLDSFSVSWKDHLDGVDWVFNDYSYDLRYDLYVDDSLVARDIDGTKKTWDISTNLSFTSWYVVAKIMEGDEVVESFQSEKVFQPDEIDLGLSVNWASCNLGASSPDDYGDYYAWGETKTHYRSLNPMIWKAGMEGYSWDTYSLCVYFGADSFVMTKYLEDPRIDGYGYDNKLVLELEDDVAHTKLGGRWRMPTRQEFAELSVCTWIESSYNGRSGYTVIGPNGNSIFFPAAGAINNTNLRSVGERGYYWTSTRRQASYKSQQAYCVNINGYPKPYISDAIRCYAYPIRPICEK